MEKTRNPYFDVLRGTIIIMVVGGHTFNDGLTLSGGVACLAGAVREVFNCVVPLFLAISGFFVGRKPVERRADRWAFWRRQLPRVYVPYLLWAMPHFVLALAGGRSWLLSLALLLCCGYGVFYFVALILQYYLLLPLIRRHNTRRGLAVAAVVTVAATGLVGYVTMVRGIGLPLLFSGGLAPEWWLYFALGVYLGTHRRDYAPRPLLLAALLFFAADVAETLWLNGLHDGGGFGVKLSSVGYATALVLFLFSRRVEEAVRRRAAWLRGLAWLGRLSYGIYLAHVPCLMLLRRFVVLPFWLAEWAAALALTCLVLAVLRALLPQRLHRWLALV